MTLWDLIDDRDRGRFQKIADSFCATVRASAQRYGKVVTGKSVGLLHCDLITDRLNQNILEYDLTFGDKPAQFWQLETGRKAGKMPPVNNIYEWSKNKGITFSDDKERKSFAWALARKIAREGTKQYRMGDKLTKIFDSNWIKFERSVDVAVNKFVADLIVKEKNNLDQTFKE